MCVFVSPRVRVRIRVLVCPRVRVRVRVCVCVCVFFFLDEEPTDVDGSTEIKKPTSSSSYITFFLSTLIVDALRF